MNLGKSQLSISYLVHSMGAMGELITTHTHKHLHIMDKVLPLQFYLEISSWNGAAVKREDLYNNNVYIVQLQYQYTTYYSVFSLLLHVNKVSVTFKSEIVGNNTRTICDIFYGNRHFYIYMRTICHYLQKYSCWQIYFKKF